MSSPARRFRALPAAFAALAPAALPAVAAGLAALALTALPAAAQFGKNKVQYQSFDWYTITTEHFDIYYYKEEEESAKVAARMAERAYTRLSRILDHEIEERVPVIIYASHTDFQQTNITPGLISEGTGGITEFAKRRVFLPFTGSYGEFDHVLSHELVHAFQVDLMFGSGAEANPFAFQPPLWFMEGMAEYLSIGGVDPNTEMWLRWSALDGQLIPLQYMDRVYDIRVYRIGQAIFDFIGERYGDEKIAELLRKMVYFRSADLAFQKTLGMDLESLNEEWESYVRRKYYPQIVDLGRAEDQARRLFGRKGFRGVHVAPSLSPDGDRLVYIKEDRFSKNIELASAIDGKPLDTLVKGETSGDFESLRYMYTAIGWSPDGSRIAFPSKKGGEDVLNILDVESGSVLRTFGFHFDAVYSPSYHPDGRRIVFTGIRGGKSDLYRVDLDDGSLSQITNDPYLARDPQYSPDGKRIAFVTDRGPDTDIDNLVFGDPQVALLDAGSGEITLLPGQGGKSIAPHWGPDGNYLAFVSDRDGISDLYVQDLRTDRLFRLTNLTTGVTGLIESSPPFSWSRDGRRIVFTTFTGEGWALYGIDDPLERIHEKEIDAPAPMDRIARAEYGTVVPWREPPLRLAAGPDAAGSRETTPGAVMPAPDGVATNGGAHGAGNDAAEGPSAGDAAAAGGRSGDEAIAADENADGEAPAASLTDLLVPATALSVAGPGTAGPRAPGLPAPEPPDDAASLVLAEVIRDTRTALPDESGLHGTPYKLKWSPDFIGASPFFASNVGFAGSASIAISDILSNHVIQIGAAVYGSIEDSDLFLGYYNQKNRTNWGVAAFQYRNDFGVFTAQDRIGYDSQIFRGLQGVVSRPFSKYNRIELTARGVALSRRAVEETFSTGGFIIASEESSDLLYFAGPEIALVSDTSVWGYTGPMHGRRARLSSEQAFGDLQFNTTIADYRKYIPLGRSTVFATRLIGGISRGRTPQQFRIGGAHTLRGIGYGNLEGRNIGLLNMELRFPLVETLRLGWPLRIGLGGVGGVFFFDAGGAFEDHARFMRDGALDDFAAGYGFGFRLSLGYFALKYDFAWPTTFRSVGPEREYFTIGVDF